VQKVGIPLAPLHLLHLSLVRLELLAAEQRGGDLQLENLVGPFVDPADAYVHQVPAGTVEGGPAAAAEDLHGVVGSFPSSVR